MVPQQSNERNQRGKQVLGRKGKRNNGAGRIPCGGNSSWPVSCHGDDFLAEGCTDGLDRLDAVMTKGFEVKILPRIGAQESGGMVQEGRHLHRLIKWTPDGFTWQADPKYAQQLVADLGLTGTKGVDSPASKETGKGNRDLDKPLSDLKQKSFAGWQVLPCTCH